MSTLLTDVEKAGGCGLLPANATREERLALSIHLGVLKHFGHAIVADEVYEHGELNGMVRVTHYKSCLVCLGLKKAEVYRNG